ncbi:TrgA family protein [Aestuariibius insulae]|uniref:TrgA family protein n=1 Tax=Aestuariibius insulae TaxID=2058287 RepID=UPI00345E8927
MPTAGRLTGAICFGALAYYLSVLYVPLLPEGAAPGAMIPINTFIGVVMGWVVAGKRAGGGLTAAISYGLTTLVTIIFWALFVHSGTDMYHESLRLRYDNATEAVVAVFEQMMEYAQPMLISEYIIPAIVGCLIAGLVTEAIGSRFP